LAALQALQQVAEQPGAARRQQAPQEPEQGATQVRRQPVQACA
jgi:hypothetical protein